MKIRLAPLLIISCYSAFFVFVFGVLFTSLPPARWSVAVQATAQAKTACDLPDVVSELDTAPRLWISAAEEIDEMNAALATVKNIDCATPSISSAQSIEDLERLVAVEVDELARKFATQ